jgi:small-conductance mechanosensitive channel
LQFATIEAAWRTIREQLASVPPAIYSLLLLIVAVSAAIAVHRIGLAMSRRTLASRHPDAYALVARMQAPAQLALILLAVSLALPALSLNAETELVTGNALQLAFIILAGWMTITCTKILADLYLRRFDIGADDNLLARKHITQVRVLTRTAHTLIVLVTIAAALMTFDSVRQYGVGLFASAGIAGIVVGLAARPVLSNLLAGVQLAVTQPIRIDDAVVVENEWGRIEDITATYVVIKLWDLRRLIVPLSYFIERPFQNWTRETSSLVGSVTLHTDYSVPVDRVREKLAEILKDSKQWDGNVAVVQVIEAHEQTIELRVLVSARDSSATSDLRCAVREQLIAFLQKDCPGALPRRRVTIDERGSPMAASSPAPSQPQDLFAARPPETA